MQVSMRRCVLLAPPVLLVPLAAGCSCLMQALGSPDAAAQAAQATDAVVTAVTGNPLIGKGASALMYGAVLGIVAIFGSSEPKGNHVG